jgi:hypothetical protein
MQSTLSIFEENQICSYILYANFMQCSINGTLRFEEQYVNVRLYDSIMLKELGESNDCMKIDNE